jgi:hypothetical protein
MHETSPICQHYEKKFTHGPVIQLEYSPGAGGVGSGARVSRSMLDGCYCCCLAVDFAARVPKFLPNYRASWLKQQRSWLMYERCAVRVSARTPATATKVSLGFVYCLQARPLPSTWLRICYSLFIQLLYDWLFTANQFVLAPNRLRRMTSVFFRK